MKKSIFGLSFTAVVSASLLSILLLSVPTVEAQSGGYYGRDDNYYPPERDYRDDYQYQREQDERRDLERERNQIERERIQLEREKMRASVAATAAPIAERCPAGFQPSENKCSREERQRGCKDMRLPGGLGCVRR